VTGKISFADGQNVIWVCYTYQDVQTMSPQVTTRIVYYDTTTFATSIALNEKKIPAQREQSAEVFPSRVGFVLVTVLGLEVTY